MPKAPRGRRPPPNPKRRPQRTFPHPVATGAAAVAEREDEEGLQAPVRPAPASVRATAVGTRRAALAAVPRRRFSESIAEYAYVAGDLKRIGALAFALVVLLILLSFVVH